MNENEWRPVATAPEKVVIETKIDEGGRIRNIQTLKRVGNLWWFPDMSMYCYYRPTHWRPTADTGEKHGV